MLKINKITDKELVKVAGQHTNNCTIVGYDVHYNCKHDCHTKGKSEAYKSSKK